MICPAHGEISNSVVMMVGDVSGAFRHIRIATDCAHTRLFDDYLVEEVAYGFSRCVPPALYFLSESIISY